MLGHDTITVVVFYYPYWLKRLSCTSRLLDQPRRLKQVISVLPGLYVELPVEHDPAPVPY